MNEQNITKRRIDGDKDLPVKRLRAGLTEASGIYSQQPLEDATSMNIMTSADFNNFEILSFDEDGECSTVLEPTAPPSLDLFPPDMLDIVGSVEKPNECSSDMYFEIPSFDNEQHQITFNPFNEISGLQQSSDPMCHNQQPEVCLPMNNESQLDPQFVDLIDFQATKVSLEHQGVAPEQNINIDVIFPAKLDSQAQRMSHMEHGLGKKKNPEVGNHVSDAARGLSKATGYRQEMSENGTRVISNSGNCNNSNLELASGLRNISGIEHKEDSSDDSLASLSPISFDSPDDDLVGADFVELANKCSRDKQSFINMEDTYAALLKRNSDAEAAACASSHAIEQQGGLASRSPRENRTGLLCPFSKISQIRHGFLPQLYSMQTRKPTGTQITVLQPDSKNYEETMPADRTNTRSADSPRSVKGADSDDCSARRKCQSAKEQSNSVRDFYEDDSSLEDNTQSDDEVDNLSDTFNSHMFSTYEQLFDELRKIVNWAPNRFKYEIYNLLYPVMAIGYLRMIFSGKIRRAKMFVESSMRYIDQSYMPRVKKLMTVQMPGDMPNRAKNLIYDDNKQVAISLAEETYYFLLVCMEGWSCTRQMMFMRYFDLFPVGNNGEPRKLTRIGSPLLPKISCALAEIAKETKEASPRPARRKRLRKDAKNSPYGNVSLPVGNRMFTPIPKRREMERQKEDEERRVSLDRDNLPSVYLYTARENAEAIICASFSNATTILAVGTAAAAIHCFSLTSSKLSEVKSVKNLKTTDTNKSKGEERVLQPIKKNMKRTLYGHQGAVYGCSFAPHDRLMLSCSQDRTVRCWCMQSWNCVVIYPGHCAAIYNVIYAPMGYYFATASDDRTARIWTQDSKKPFCIMVGHLAEVVCCRFHPNRHYLATGSADCTVRMWDVLKASQVRVFSGHRDIVNAVRFSACGKYLLSGADDHFVIVWDVESESIIRSLSHHKASINCIEIAVDNKLVIIGGEDCQMSIWDFEGLTQAYEAEKQTPSNSDENNSKSKQPKQSGNDFLVNSYASKGTPFYRLQMTGQNLLLGFCVRSAYAEQLEREKQLEEANNKYTEWLEFLDILKLKACFAKSRNQEANPTKNKNPKENGSEKPLDSSGDYSADRDAGKGSGKVMKGAKHKKRNTCDKDKKDSHAARAERQSDAGEKPKSNAECVATANAQRTLAEPSSSVDDGQPNKAATEKDAGSMTAKQPGHNDMGDNNTLLNNKGVEPVVHDTSSELLKEPLSGCPKGKIEGSGEKGAAPADLDEKEQQSKLENFQNCGAGSRVGNAKETEALVLQSEEEILANAGKVESEKLEQTKAEEIVVLEDSHPSEDSSGKTKVGLVAARISDDQSHTPQE